jgi:hypothetical protein
VAIRSLVQVHVTADTKPKCDREAKATFNIALVK